MAENARVENFLKTKTENEGKWVKLIEDLEVKMKKIERENEDLKGHMKDQTQKAEKEIEKNYLDLMESRTERMKEEKEDAVRAMRLQMAKMKLEDDEGKPETQEAIKKELDFQKAFIHQSEEQAKKAEQRTLTACSSGSNAMQCYIGSVENVQTIDKYTDQQAEMIVNYSILEKTFILLNGHQMYTE